MFVWNIPAIWRYDPVEAAILILKMGDVHVHECF